MEKGTSPSHFVIKKCIFYIIYCDHSHDYDGKHTDFLGLVKTGHIFIIKGADGKEKLVVFVVPPEKITCFEESYLLTYLFKGSETENWFKVFDVPYEHLKLDRAGNMDWSLVDWYQRYTSQPK